MNLYLLSIRFLFFAYSFRLHFSGACYFNLCSEKNLNQVPVTCICPYMAFRLHCQNESIYHKKLVFIKQKASFGDYEWFMVLGFSWNPKLSLYKFPLSIVFQLWKLPHYFTQLLLFTVPSRKKFIDKDVFSLLIISVYSSLV